MRFASQRGRRWRRAATKNGTVATEQLRSREPVTGRGLQVRLIRPLMAAEGAGACVGDAGPWVMTAFADSDQPGPTSDERVLHAATAAHLGRYRGQSRLHTGSDLKTYLTWCA